MLCSAPRPHFPLSAHHVLTEYLNSLNNSDDIRVSVIEVSLFFAYFYSHLKNMALVKVVSKWDNFVLLQTICGIHGSFNI